MPTSLQLLIVAGLLVGAGLALLALRLAPAQADLANALTRLSPAAPVRRVQPDEAGASDDLAGWLGLHAMRHLPAVVWGRVPHKELRLLQRPVGVFYGQKILYALAALIVVPLLGWLFSLSLELPAVVPAAASIAGAVGMWFVPNIDVVREARLARVDFKRSLGAYVDLVALERNAGAGPRQAMENAAQIGDSWVFRRLREELGRSRWSGQAPWDALSSLADELGLPDLADLADIMRLSGEEGAQIYGTLRARSTAMRSAQLAAETTKANELNERIAIPGNLLGMIFLLIMLGPALFRMILP